MNEPTIFISPEFGEIRTLETEDGKVLFCGTDVAKALGYSKPNNAIAAHCRCALKQGIPHPQSPNKTIEMSFISEGDVYRLITHSKLSGAEKFEAWVFDEVLPAIRKTGSYALPKMSAMEMIAGIANGCVELEKRMTQLENKLDEDRTTTIKETLSYGRINGTLRKEISTAVKMKSLEICHFASTFDKMGKRVMANIYKSLQKHFNVESYNDLTFNQYTDAIIFIKLYEPDTKLSVAITKAMPKVDMSLLSSITETA